MDDYEIEYLIKQLTQEHRELDDAISGQARKATVDMMEMQRLKKRKLLIKDEIIKLQSMQHPDIIA